MLLILLNIYICVLCFVRFVCIFFLANFGFSKIDQSLFSIRQNILKHIPFIEEPLMPLEDCYSPCDIISNRMYTFCYSNIKFCNYDFKL